MELAYTTVAGFESAAARVSASCSAKRMLPLRTASSSPRFTPATCTRSSACSTAATAAPSSNLSPSASASVSLPRLCPNTRVCHPRKPLLPVNTIFIPGFPSLEVSFSASNQFVNLCLALIVHQLGDPGRFQVVQTPEPIVASVNFPVTEIQDVAVLEPLNNGADRRIGVCFIQSCIELLQAGRHLAEHVELNKIPASKGIGQRTPVP